MTASGDGGVSPRVVIEPMGGLGNQLFIYATGRALAERCAAPLAIDLRWFGQTDERRFELDAFSLVGEVIPAVLATRSVPSWVRPRRLAAALGRRLAGPDPAAFMESTPGFDSRVLDLSAPVRIRGYFQSWRYFDSLAEVLRLEVSRLVEPSKWFLDMSRALSDGDPWIAVHVRRGDYLKPRVRDAHGLLPDGYYRRGVEELRDRVPGARVALFSDDVPLGLEALGSDHPVDLVVEPPAGSRPLESVLLMALADGVLTSNSSFSWWGAWLGDAPDRPVICPRPWFRTLPYVAEDLVLPSWQVREAVR